MSLFVPPRKFDTKNPEWMDRHDQDPALMADAFKQLEKFNRKFGGYKAVLDDIMKIPREKPKDLELEVFDFCTGAGDVMCELVLRVRRKGQRIHVIAMDNHEAAVAYARANNSAPGVLDIEQVDVVGQSFPYLPMSCDICVCTLALHHFDRPQALFLLRRMWKICRTGMVISDLRRNRLPILFAKLFAPMFTRNPICCHDADASVRAAFSIKELAEMAEEARIGWFKIERRWPFRMTMLALKPNAAKKYLQK